MFVWGYFGLIKPHILIDLLDFSGFFEILWRFCAKKGPQKYMLRRKTKQKQKNLNYQKNFFSPHRDSNLCRFGLGGKFKLEPNGCEL